MSRFDMLPSAVAPVIDHSSFGPLRASGRLPDGGWRWEALDLIDTPHGQVDLSFDAGLGGPGRAHEAQLALLLAQLDTLTSAAAPSIKSALAHCVDLPLSNPWAELKWHGAHVTGDDGMFQLHYDCKSWPDAMVTVQFERSKPVLVRIED